MKPKEFVLKAPKAKPKKLVATSQKNLIKALLAARGIRISDIARELNVSVPTVSLVISGRDSSRRIKTAVAEKLGFSPEELWPEKQKGDT